MSDKKRFQCVDVVCPINVSDVWIQRVEEDICG
jgi:hypothetical protein